MNEPKLPGTPVCKGMVTSLMDDVTVREQDGERSLDALVARRCERMRSRLCSFTEQGRRKVVTGYNKVITVITFYWLLITQVLKGITSSRRCERKSTVGNSARLPSSTSVRDYESYTFYSVLECLGDLLRYRLMFMLFLIIHGLFKQYDVIKDENKEIWQFMNTLTFRLVAVKLGYVTYYSATFLETFVIWIGNTGTTFTEEISYCCPYADFWASCRMYLHRCTIILVFCGKYRQFCAFTYLYMCKCHQLRLSCTWASYFLAFVVKLFTLVYFFSKARLLMRKSHKKYQSNNLTRLALVEKAYARNRSFLGHNRSYWREL